MSEALQIFSKGFYLFKFDLKSGYHHVESFPEHRKYLAFTWDFGDGVVKYFEFTVLPFGALFVHEITEAHFDFMEVSGNSHGYFS